MSDWSKQEVVAVVRDYLDMLEFELAGLRYSKAAHLRRLQESIKSRSRGSIEFKRQNISAALINAGIRYIDGYKPLGNYQGLLDEVLADEIPLRKDFHKLAVADADRPIVVPEVEDILRILKSKPAQFESRKSVAEPLRRVVSTNYLEREARNKSLGDAGELFVLNYERARLLNSSRPSLAGKIEHTARVKSEHEGYDILSFDESGEERLIEVKTTKYGSSTPFFVSRNEVSTSERNANIYVVYRLYSFAKTPSLYTLPGAISGTCNITAESFVARPR